MCRLLKVSRAGYYKWNKGTVNKRAIKRVALAKQVVQTYYEFNKIYGAPRITKELKEQGIPCSHNHVADLLREYGLRAKNGKGFKYNKSNPGLYNISENLLRRNFKALKPNEKWVTDLTYIYVNGKWIYLSVVVDLFSRAVVGWAIDKSMTEKLICDAFDMAAQRRDMEPDLIVHSDQGVQYRSHMYQEKLIDYGCRISMSRRANCWDNAVVESFFSRLKVELIFGQKFTTMDEAKASIFEYIEIFYNRKRRHSAIGYIAPMKFEELNS